MQRLLDKWGLWIALFVVGGIISYGIISNFLRPEEVSKTAKPAASKSFN